MKKYLPYAAIIIVFVVAIGWYIHSQSAESINQREGDFAVKGNITKIVLDDTEKKHLELTKKGDIWLVNGKYEAREELIKLLLEALNRVTSLAPVPHNGHDHVIREMMASDVKVQVFKGSDKPSKVYYVGGPTVDSRGTYMLLEMNGKTASRPHITYLPGYNGYLTPRFNTDEENWRTRIAFNEQENDFVKLSVEYPYAEQNSFSITRVADDSFAVAPLDEKYRITAPYEQKYVKQYLSFYNPIYIEAFENSNSKKDSIMNTTPYCRFRITKRDGSLKSVNLYYLPLNKRSKTEFDLNDKKLSHDIDHYYASLNDTDFALVQYYVFGKLLRSYKDFYFKPKQ